jgi:hypothetical protein
MGVSLQNLQVVLEPLDLTLDSVSGTVEMRWTKEKAQSIDENKWQTCGSKYVYIQIYKFYEILSI